MRCLLFLLACLPYFASSAVHFLNYNPATQQGGMYAQSASVTFVSDVDIVSPVAVDGVTYFYGLSIEVYGTSQIVWDPTVTTPLNGSSLSVMATNTSYVDLILPDMSYCQPKVSVDPTVSSILRVTFVPPEGAVCVIKQGNLVKLDIPYMPIAAHQVRIITISLTMAAYFALPDKNGFIYTLDRSVTASKVVVPYTISETAVVANHIDFVYAYPSTAVIGVLPTFWKLSFTLGVTLQSTSSSAATIAIHANDAIFAANPPAGLTFAVGETCVTSFAQTRVIKNKASAVRAILIITLSPPECIVVQDIPIVVVIPQGYLAPATQTGMIFLNIATNEEVGWQWSRGYLSAGATTVKAFTAVVPTTTQTLAIPSITVVFTLNKGLRLGDTIHLGAMATGVFRPFVKTIDVVFSPTCTGTASTANGFTELVVTPSSSCIASFVAGSTWKMVIPENAMAPNLPAGTVVAYNLYTTQDRASLFLEAYTITASGCSIGSLPGYIATPYGAVDIASSLTVAERALLISHMTLMSPSSSGYLTCQSSDVTVWLFKIRFATEAKVITSVGAPTVAIISWGFMYTIPIYAITVTYPVATVSPLWNELKLTAGLGAVAFIVRIERMLSSGLVVNINNPLVFEVLALKCNVVQVLVLTRAGVAGVPIVGEVGKWAQNAAGDVLVHSKHGPLFVGYCAPVLVAPDDDGSDEALLGLLALIAVPFLLCCCLLALLAYFLWRRKKNNQCCDPCACPVECTTYVCPTQQMLPCPAPCPSAMYPTASPYLSPSPYL